MRRIFHFLIWLCFTATFFLGAGCSGSSRSDALLNKLIREKQPGFVYDFAGLIDASDRQAIRTTLQQLEALTTAQVKVVTLPSLDGGEIRDFANRLFQGWGIGIKGKDNGVLLLMAQDERKIWIEVGYGLEGALPDGRVGRLLDENVIPDFKRGQFSTGLRKGALAVAQIVAAEYKVTLTAGPAPVSSTPPQHSLIATIFQGLLVVFFIIFAIRHPFLAMMLLSGGRGGGSSGGFGGGGGGGFGGGLSGGGGAGRSW